MIVRVPLFPRRAVAAGLMLVALVLMTIVVGLDATIRWLTPEDHLRSPELKGDRQRFK